MYTMTPKRISLIVFDMVKLSLCSSTLGVTTMANSTLPGTEWSNTNSTTTTTTTTTSTTITTMNADVRTASSEQDDLALLDVSDVISTTYYSPINTDMTDATDLPTKSQEESSKNSNKKAFSWNQINWSWVIILQLISAIVGVVGNFLVIIVLFQRRRKSKSTDTLISGLACADFLTSVFLIPIPWASYVPYTWVGEVYCRVVFTQSLLWISITASTYLLMSISVELYIAVVYPLHYNKFITRRRVSIFIVLIWLLSVLSGLFVFIVYTNDRSVYSCTELYMLDHAQTIVAYYWFCLRLVVPCLTMLVTQILIARELSDQSRNFKGITNASTTGGKLAPSFHIVARNRVLKMMLIVILIYVVCWTPNQIAYLGYNLGWVPESYLNSTLHLMLTVLGFYNSCANPVIYAARYPEFREALRDILTCTTPKNAPLFDKEDISKKNSGMAKTNTDHDDHNQFIDI